MKYKFGGKNGGLTVWRLRDVRPLLQSWLCWIQFLQLKCATQPGLHSSNTARYKYKLLSVFFNLNIREHTIPSYKGLNILVRYFKTVRRFAQSRYLLFRRCLASILSSGFFIFTGMHSTPTIALLFFAFQTIIFFRYSFWVLWEMLWG